MAKQQIDIAFWNYDRTQALANGTVKVEGVETNFHTARIVTEIFEGMIRERKYDVSELGLSYFLSGKRYVMCGQSRVCDLFTENEAKGF